MTEQSRTALKALQELDVRILDARRRIQDFDPLLADVEEPALVLENDANTTRNRLTEMRQESRRLEISTDEKKTRLKRLEERLGTVRNLREEAAVSAELDMVRRALQSDEQEGYTVLDQIRKLETRLTEVEAALVEAKALVEPRRNELLAERADAEGALASLDAERATFAESLDPRELRLYESIRSGGRRMAVAELTADGACGSCFGVMPLQIQNEVRHGTSLIRCEACGVILAAPAPGEAQPEAPAPAKRAKAAKSSKASKAAKAAPPDEPDDEPDDDDLDEEDFEASDEE